MGLPEGVTLHSVFGPQGDGSHGSGLGSHLGYQSLINIFRGLYNPPVVVTDIARATVRIHLALSPASLDSVRHGDEARQAATHRVTLSVLHTLSVRTTW